MRLRQAQRSSTLVHLRHKSGDASGNPHSSCTGGIVAGGQQHAVTQGTLGDCVPLHQSHGGALHLNRLRINGELCVQIAALQTEQRRHDFRRARHGMRFPCVLLVEHLAGHGFHQHARNRRYLRLLRRTAGQKSACQTSYGNHRCQSCCNPLDDSFLHRPRSVPKKF